MPRVTEGESSKAAARGSEARPGSPPASRHTVLVIDDEPAILTLAKNALGPSFNVLCALSTREADALLAAHPVQVVVCDLSMPDENGLEYLSRLRQAYPLISRILLTGCAESEAILTAVNRCGVLNYLVKPILVAEFLRAVTTAAELHDAAERHAGLGRENADLRHSLRRLLSRSAPLSDMSTKQVFLLALGLLALLAVVLLVGVLVLMILYALKSALGIDIFPNWHLGDSM